eukprot:s109_g13.t3
MQRKPKVVMQRHCCSVRLECREISKKDDDEEKLFLFVQNQKVMGAQELARVEISSTAMKKLLKPLPIAMVMMVDAVEESGDSEVTALVRQLSSSKPRDRWKAAAALGRMGKPVSGVASPELLRCLDDDDQDVRCAAARAVGHVCDGSAVDLLATLLEDEDGGVRWGAAEALGNIGAASASAMEALILITEDEEEDARQAAVQTLGKLAKLNVIRRAELVEPLCQALSDDEWSVRRAAAEALGRCGDEASGVRLLLQRDSEKLKGPQQVLQWDSNYFPTSFPLIPRGQIWITAVPVEDEYHGYAELTGC